LSFGATCISFVVYSTEMKYESLRVSNDYIHSLLIDPASAHPNPMCSTFNTFELEKELTNRSLINIYFAILIGLITLQNDEGKQHTV